MKHALILSLAFLTITTSAVADEARLRSLAQKLDYDAVVREVESTSSPSVVERALYVAALERIQARGRAAAEAAKLRESHPNDPWTWYAATHAPDAPADMLATSERMMALAGERPDEEMIRARARALFENGKREEAIALLDKHPRTPHAIVTRVGAMNHARGQGQLDPQTYALLEEARTLDPDNVEALYWTAAYLRFDGKMAEALPHLERAAGLTNAVRVHRDHWATLRSQNRERLIPAMEAVLARESGPAMLFTAAEVYGQLGDKEKQTALQERILKESPASLGAQWVLQTRFGNAATPEERLATARAFAAWPQHYDSWLRSEAHRQLFRALIDDPKATESDLLAALRGTKPTRPNDYAIAAVALADRKIALDEAEKLAREGIPATERFLEIQKGLDPARAEQFAAPTRASMRDALGWVLFQRGKPAEASKELLAAWELHPKSALTAYHLGRLYESQKKLEKAESMYRKGYLLPAGRKNPNADAMKELYQKRYGSLTGWDDYLKSAKDAEAEARRKEILAARTKKPLPPFTLESLDGKPMTQKDLAGKIAVVSFWGIWCGPCVAEMPDFQKLVNKYAGDERVAIVTVNNDNDNEKVRRWMTQNKYAFPVLVDETYGRTNVRGYPTTWFVAPDGTIAYAATGSTENLIEEFSWRIEALR